MTQNEVVNNIFPETEKMPVYWNNLLAQEKIVINQGGTYSTKSQSLIRVLFTYAILFPNTKIEVVAETFPKLRGDTMEIAEGIMNSNKFLKAHIKTFAVTTSTISFKNGSKMVFKSYEKPADAEGPKRDILYMNEARNIPWMTAYKLMKRTNKKIFIDYNPTQVFWAHEKLINCQPGPNGKKEFPSVKVIRSWHIHNEFISIEKHDEIENIADKEMHKAYARGLTATLSGTCYPNWSKIDFFPPDHEFQSIVWGIDLGYTNDPTTIIKIGVGHKSLPYDYIFKELCYVPGVSEGEMGRLMTVHGYKRGQMAFMDYDVKMKRTLRRMGFLILNAKKYKGSTAASILYLRSKRCAYTKDSENIDEEKGKYVFQQDANGNTLNEPVEGADHCMRAIEYGCFTNAIKRGDVKGVVFDIESEVG